MKKFLLKLGNCGLFASLALTVVNIIKSIVGIGNYAYELNNYTWGCRMTPTIARFYLNNINI